MVNPQPERIGKYRIVEPIGRGGMGSVYKAHDPVLDRMVAIKVMTEGAAVGTEAHERFLREAQSAARLNHPNIITVYELGEDQGQVFIVMELLEGEPLSRLVGRVPPPPLRRKLAIMIQICEGLGFAHQRGVVHRDVKPANIFVLQNGQVKILDFGIARLVSSELTRTGLLMGTPNYMSPEQARGRRTDARSDIFSAGVVFYELLSGRKPFVGEDYFETMEKVRSEDPRPLPELVPGLPASLVRAVERALAKDPAVRYQTLEDLRVDLLALPDVAPGDTASEGLREAVERKFAEVVRLHRMLVAAIGSSALGEETLPIADPIAEGRASDAGLETVLRDLESQTDRLRALARAVERLEPAVARGVAAFERGAFAEAVAELDAVLREIPQHQRARDYRERARLEHMRERTVRSVGAGSLGSTARPVPGSPEALAARGAEAGTAVATPPPRAASQAAPVTVAGTQPTQAVSGTRARLVLVGVALGAVVTGGVFLFRPSTPPRDAVPAPAVAPAPPPTPAPAPSVSTPSPPVSAPSPPAGTPSPAKPPAPRPAAAPAKPAAAPPSPGPGEGGATQARLTPEDAKVVEDALTLGQLFRARGDHERALREYRRVLAVDPKHAEARQGVAEVEALLKSRQ